MRINFSDLTNVSINIRLLAQIDWYIISSSAVNTVTNALNIQLQLTKQLSNQLSTQVHSSKQAQLTGEIARI